MPAPFERLCPVIDAIPADIHLEVSEELEVQFSSSSGLLNGLESSQLLVSTAPDNNGPSFLDPQMLEEERDGMARKMGESLHRRR